MSWRRDRARQQPASQTERESGSFSECHQCWGQGELACGCPGYLQSGFSWRRDIAGQQDIKQNSQTAMTCEHILQNSSPFYKTWLPAFRFTGQCLLLSCSFFGDLLVRFPNQLKVPHTVLEIDFASPIAKASVGSFPPKWFTIFLIFSQITSHILQILPNCLPNSCLASTMVAMAGDFWNPG